VSVGLGCESSSSRHRPGQVLADLAPRAKVVQTVVCSTFTRGAKPATRKVADGERMNPQGKGGAYAPIPGDDEHQGDEDLENRHAGARAPDPRVWLRSPRFFTPYRPARTRQDLPCTSAGEPRTPVIVVQLACN
jgi:hypothetical protein